MEDFLAANEDSRLRLGDLLSRLPDEDLALRLDAAWTIGAVLAHLAFWDQRALTLLERWSLAGVGASPVDVDAINDACRPLLCRLSPAAVRDAVLTTATAVDAAIAQLPGTLVVDIQDHATQFHLSRAVHRNFHIDEIEARLAGINPGNDRVTSRGGTRGSPE